MLSLSILLSGEFSFIVGDFLFCTIVDNLRGGKMTDEWQFLIGLLPTGATLHSVQSNLY